MASGEEELSDLQPQHLGVAPGSQRYKPQEKPSPGGSSALCFHPDRCGLDKHLEQQQQQQHSLSFSRLSPGAGAARASQHWDPFPPRPAEGTAAAHQRSRPRALRSCSPRCVDPDDVQVTEVDAFLIQPAVAGTSLGPRRRGQVGLGRGMAQTCSTRREG